MGIGQSRTTSSAFARSEFLEFVVVRAFDLRKRRSDQVGNQRFFQYRWDFLKPLSATDG
jgi:hypothetical protein